MTHQRKRNWPTPLLTLIAASHSRDAMAQVRDYSPDEHAWKIFQDTCQGMLKTVHPEGSSCVMMSALLAISLEEPLGTVIPVVAGALKLGSDYMYGSNSAVDGRQVFSENSQDWDGHCWVIFGDYIVDISLGRTARMGHCRAPLARHVIANFGDQVGMIALTEGNARHAGLRYLPRYVLTPDQVLASAGGAIEKFHL